MLIILPTSRHNKGFLIFNVVWYVALKYAVFIPKENKSPKIMKLFYLKVKLFTLIKNYVFDKA